VIDHSGHERETGGELAWFVDLAPVIGDHSAVGAGGRVGSEVDLAELLSDPRESGG
jgi:hypothetical protein